MNLKNAVLIFRETSQKYNLTSVRAIVGVVAIMAKVAVVSEIDPARPVGVHRPKVKGRGSIRSVRGEDNFAAIGAVGRIIIINSRVIGDVQQGGSVRVHDKDLTSERASKADTPVKDDLAAIRAEMRASTTIISESSKLCLACSIGVDHPNSTAAASSRNKNDLCAVGTKRGLAVAP